MCKCEVVNTNSHTESVYYSHNVCVRCVCCVHECLLYLISRMYVCTSALHIYMFFGYYLRVMEFVLGCALLAYL